MPGDFNQYRANALRCAELARSARTPELKNLMLEGSKNWHMLALELEHGYLLLSTDDPGPARRRSRRRLARPLDLKAAA
jgi:hypothetical protein